MLTRRRSVSTRCTIGVTGSVSRVGTFHGPITAK